MSSYFCEQCGSPCIATETGYITGCKHYRRDRAPTKEELESIIEQRPDFLSELQEQESDRVL